MQIVFWQLSSYHLTATELSHKNTHSSGYQSSMYPLINISNPHMPFRTKQCLGNSGFCFPKLNCITVKCQQRSLRMLPLSAAYSRSWNYAKTIINSFQKVRVKCHISIYGMQHTRRIVTWKPEQFPYLVIERAINVSPVDGGIERKVLPVFSFKVFKVRVPGCAVPEKTKKDTKHFAVWYLTSLYQCFPQLKEWKATIKISNVCYQTDEKWKQAGLFLWHLGMEVSGRKLLSPFLSLLSFLLCALFWGQNNFTL